MFILPHPLDVAITAGIIGSQVSTTKMGKFMAQCT